MQNQSRKIVFSAVFAALVCVATAFVQIPAGTGYINAGDAVVLIAAFILGPIYGAAAGGIGSMLADLLAGYPAYAIGTFLIKVLVAVSAGIIYKICKKSRISIIIGGLAGEIVMAAGYLAYEAFILGYGAAAAASIPANCIQASFAIIISVVIIGNEYLKKFLGELK